MALSLDDLTTPLTRAQVEASIYDVLGIVGVDTTSWKSGAVVRTMITATSIVLAAFSSLTASVARGGFLELAAGDWLTLVARYVYGVERVEATFAEGTVTLTNAGGGVYALSADDLVVANPTTGKTYRNTGSIALGALATVTVPIRATEAGAASTSTPGAITSMVTSLLGVTCTNASAVVGQDAESDPTLRQRCSEKLGSLSPNGPWDAYTYAARGALTQAGIPVGVTRVRITKDGFGNVNVYLATASGVVTGSAANPATDLGAVNEAIQQLAAPLAVTANVASATAVTIPVTYQVWIYNTTGMTAAQIQAAIDARLTAFFSAMPIGGHVIGGDPGKVFQDALRAVISGTRPEIFHVVVSAPAADTVLSLSEVAVLGTITATISQVAPGDGF